MLTTRLTLAAILAVSAVISLAPSSAQIPEGVPRIGTLSFGPKPNEDIREFVGALNKLGHIEGRNVVIESRYAEGHPERLPGLASELVRLKPNVIFAIGTDVAVSVKKATTEIPVVFVASGDPIGVGLVYDLAHPGGNVTGVTLLSSELSGKRVELLKEIRSSISRVGALWNPDHLDYDFVRLRLPHVSWACVFNHWRCGARVTLRRRSKPRSTARLTALSSYPQGSLGSTANK